MGGSARASVRPYHLGNRKGGQAGGVVPAASGAMSREQLFLEHLPLVERVAAWVCARRGLRGADAEDFASTVKTRLIENDFEILARFEGRSSLKTYLAVVVNRLYLDFQVRRFGKWRPSAEARRLGPVALRLERLVHRDGLSFDEACGVLNCDPQVRETRDELLALSLRLPPRAGRDRSIAAPEPTTPGTSTVERDDRQALADRTFATIRRTLGGLPARDRLFLRLHVESGLTVAQAARTLGEDQKRLYRRKEALLELLRSDLEATGIRAQDAQELLSALDWEAALGEESPNLGREQPGPRPSNEEDGTRSRAGER
jgi:RNA polymerase sigma factor (sigma-70 family)